jgi:hypothetical protein
MIKVHVKGMVLVTFAPFSNGFRPQKEKVSIVKRLRKGWLKGESIKMETVKIVIIHDSVIPQILEHTQYTLKNIQAITCKNSYETKVRMYYSALGLRPLNTLRPTKTVVTGLSQRLGRIGYHSALDKLW